MNTFHNALYVFSANSDTDQTPKSYDATELLTYYAELRVLCELLMCIYFRVACGSWLCQGSGADRFIIAYYLVLVYYFGSYINMMLNMYVYTARKANTYMNCLISYKVHTLEHIKIETTKCLYFFLLQKYFILVIKFILCFSEQHKKYVVWFQH